MPEFIKVATTDDIEPNQGKLVEVKGKKIALFLEGISSPRSMDIYLSAEGYILLRPMAHIPANEAWIWQDEDIRNSFTRALAEARTGKTTSVDNLADFLEDL